MRDHDLEGFDDARARGATRPPGAEHGAHEAGVPAFASPPPALRTTGDVLRLQRLAGNAATSALLEEADPVPSSGGRSLDPEVRTDMEQRLGHDFGDVRIHTDAAAHESASAFNARAYTTGSDIVFQRDAYDPGSAAGATTLAHELTHVVQQRSGPVDGTDDGHGVSVSDPSDRFEREAAATADRAMSADSPGPISSGAPESLQREVDEGEAALGEPEEELDAAGQGG